MHLKTGPSGHCLLMSSRLLLALSSSTQTSIAFVSSVVVKCLSARSPSIRICARRSCRVLGSTHNSSIFQRIKRNSNQ
ncbi:Hypothetical protein NTJ_13907 [Nesidiocoris tenuis]|uniref:Secreted protein n=1 Tax=Nesidiocoris tenuis TaxID=355587 RepID=A0ABN7B9M8_9HEMI|nr:Hypothetical protein NTJ_13907 [Nesidiocoris tenuis]